MYSDWNSMVDTFKETMSPTAISDLKKELDGCAAEYKKNGLILEKTVPKGTFIDNKAPTEVENKTLLANATAQAGQLYTI